MSIATNFPTIRPSLNLDFANTGSLDPRVTFSRASTATYYDGVTTAKAEENLLTYSQAFDNAAWAKNNVTVTADTTAAPDGTTTADTITDNATNSSHYTYYIASSIVSAGTTYAISCYLKAGTSNYGYLCLTDAATAQRYFSADFDLSGGTVRISGAGTSGTLTSATITSVGSGWYRCVIVGQVAAVGSMRVGVGVSDGTTSFATFGTIGYVGSGSNIYAWGAQVEQRSSVTAYTATTTQPITTYIPVLQTAAANVARFDHNPTTGEALGLLIEEQRTNLLTYSEQFDNAAWTKTNGAVTANFVVAPDGTLTGDLYTPTAGVTFASVTCATVSQAKNGTYTGSVFIKSAGFGFAQLQVTAFSGNEISGFINLSTGATNVANGGAASGATATATNVGNGWWRVSVSGIPKVGDSTNGISLRVSPASSLNTAVFSAADGYSGIYIWGAQLEAGAFPTSYIATTSAAATRSSDTASMTGTNFSSWFNNAEGTLYAEGIKGASTYTVFYTIHDGTNNNKMESDFDNLNHFVVVSGGVTQAAIDAGTITSNILTKVSAAYQVNDFSACISGGNVVADLSGTLPIVNRINIGAAFNGFPYGARTISKIAYYPKRLTNAQLQSLTS